MRILAFTNTISLVLTLSFFSIKAKAQDNITVKQDPRFEALLNEKRKINSTVALNDRYKIQLFSGESDKAKITLTEFKQKFNGVEGTIVFNTPNYKVWVGFFRTRIEAEKFLIELKKTYGNAYIIKPQ